MLSASEECIDKITEAINHLLEGKMPAPIELSFDPPENGIGQLVQYVNALTSRYNSFAKFLFAVSRGDLDYEAPKGNMHILHSLKNLQANLRHLTWKTQQIALGDFSQRVDFMGEFSKSFNSMVEQLAAAREELLRKNEELDRTSRTDPLTGLTNRRGADEMLKKESHRASRSNKHFVTIIADIDHFKRINDTYGHDAGDAILVAVSGVLLDHVRKEDLCARWGGEEFLVLLTEVELPVALAAAERLRLSIEATETLHNGANLRVTISAGMSVYSEGEDIESCIKRSDLCLYKAKESGRNQVWLQEGLDASPRPVVVKDLGQVLPSQFNRKQHESSPTSIQNHDRD
jgi:diguanylate cyclase (GGDEF)-like protein